MNCSTPGLPVHHQLPRVHSNSHPLSWWSHPAISSFVVPFSSCPQSLPASESFPMSQLFTWGGQSTGVTLVLFNLQVFTEPLLYPWVYSGPIQSTNVYWDPIVSEKEMATHSSIPAWRIPWTEEPGGLQSMRSPRVGHDWVTNFHFFNTQKGSLWGSPKQPGRIA